MPQVNFDIKGLALALGAALVLQILFVVGLYFTGLDVDAKSIFVSGPMAIGVLILIYLGFQSSGEVSWSRQGYDFNLLALGALLSTITLQFFLKTPALPRLAQSSVALFVASKTGNSVAGMYVLLFVALAWTFLVCAMASGIELHLKAKGKTWGRADYGYAFLSYATGTSSLLVYIAVVCGGIEV
jgi:hypothetical protein